LPHAKDYAVEQNLWSLCQSQYFPRRRSIRSAKTRRAYQYSIAALSKHLGREAQLSDLDDEIMEVWLTAELNRVKSVETARHRLAKLLALWTWAAKRGLVPTFPTIERPRAPVPVPRAWQQHELARLFAAADLEGGLIGPVPARLWWRARLAFHWFCGERKGAVDLLRQEWVYLDSDPPACVIPAEARKGGFKPACYRLPPPLIEALRRIWEPSRELVFPWPHSEGKYFRDWNRILIRAHLPVGRKFKTQALRVSHATWKKKMGGDATASLMHSDPAVTIRSYLDPRMAADDDKPLFVPWQQQPPEPPRAA
jgi:hypothetical protein